MLEERLSALPPAQTEIAEIIKDPNNVLQDNANLQSAQFRRGILLTKAKAETYRKDFVSAKHSLEEALKLDDKSYKIMQDLASAYAQISMDTSAELVIYESRKYAITNYRNVTERTETSNVYPAWRNLSFLLYLSEDYPNTIEAFKTTLSFDKAVNGFDSINADFIRKYQDLAEKCSINKNCANNQEGLIDELRTRKIFYDINITHDMIENELKDPFFDIEHDKFYKCNK
ncbi:hypothetical protein [Nostoc edaphicum]|uniref:hypothetical protein n=1 Tax=Nostoc edaphicum TaxID=264686 RepID=UPI001D1421C8|nr:hypothetical protein [Nostoc edaphicum]